MGSLKFIESDRSVKLLVGERQLTMYNGDIMHLTADALVCPVNPHLDTRSGLARVICQSAGEKITHHLPMVSEPYGKVVVLPGGSLKVKYIFLTVVLGEKESEKIRLCIQRAIERAIRYAEFLRLRSIAFPVLGSPLFSPSYNLVANEMVLTVAKYFHRRNKKLQAIFFSAYNQSAFEAFCKEAKYLVENSSY